MFACPIGISEGVEPSIAMWKKAEQRGLTVMDGIAEDLPLADESYDFAMMVTTICFVDEIDRSFAEAHRILIKGGSLIPGFVDKDNTTGKIYLDMR